jgi:predicted dehydrogenase
LALRLGLIGVGDVAQRDYLPELGRLDGRAEIVVVCSRTADRAREVAGRFDVPRWTTSYDDVIAADDVDAVLNLTPIQLHAKITLAALAGGKHVYSEKPVAGTSVEAAEIQDAACDAGLVVVAAPCVMLFPQVRRAREVLGSGSLGQVHSAHGLALGGIPPWEGYISDPSPFFAADAGPLVDMSVYPLHALTGLLGPARRVSALSRRTRDSFAVTAGSFAGRTIDVDADDNWQLILELASGALACIEANNCVQGSLGPELELAGEAGSIGLSLLDVAEPVRTLSGGVITAHSIPHERESGPDHVLGVEHLIDCVERGEEPALSVEHAHHVLEVLEAARLSAAEGRTVDLSASGDAWLTPAGSRGG